VETAGALPAVSRDPRILPDEPNLKRPGKAAPDNNLSRSSSDD
jgi:hypothetical protein